MRLSGSTYFVTGALGFVVAAGRLSLAGWRRRLSPRAGATASPVPEFPHLRLPRSRAGLLQRPRNPSLRARSPSPAEPRPLTRLPPPPRAPPGGAAAAAAAPGHPRNGINERALVAASSERGAGGRLGEPGPSGEGGGAAEGGRWLPGARPHAEAQVGGGERTGRAGARLTRFGAPPGRPPPGLRHSPPRPRTQESAAPGPPTPFSRFLPPAARSRAAGPAPPRPSALHCGSHSPASLAG